MYKKIINPKTGRKVSIYGKIGKKILNNYIKLIGGTAAADSGAAAADSGAAAADSEAIEEHTYTEHTYSDPTEEQIQDEMLILKERTGDSLWINPDYLREIAIYNLEHPPDKNITRPTRIPFNRNVFSRKDFKKGRYFAPQDHRFSPENLHAIFPGDIAYSETLLSIDPNDIENLESILGMI